MAKQKTDRTETQLSSSSEITALKKALENTVKELAEKYPRSTFLIEASRSLMIHVASDEADRPYWLGEMLHDFVKYHQALRKRFPEYDFKFYWNRKP